MHGMLHIGKRARGYGNKSKIVYLFSWHHKARVTCHVSLPVEDYTSGTTITIPVPGTRTCIDFTDLIVNDDIALEGDEAFTIFIGGTPSMVTITENDGESNTYDAVRSVT